MKKNTASTKRSIKSRQLVLAFQDALNYVTHPDLPDAARDHETESACVALALRANPLEYDHAGLAHDDIVRAEDMLAIANDRIAEARSRSAGYQKQHLLDVESAMYRVLCVLRMAIDLTKA